MPRKRRPTTKEIYHLWWEYLRRSESHKKWCEGFKKERGKSESAQWPPLERLNFFFPSLAWKEIFDKSFEDWWDSFVFGKLRKIAIQDYSKAEFGLDFVMGLTHRQLLSDPYRGEILVKDFMEQFKLFFAMLEMFMPVITVNILSDFSIEKLMKDFGNIIRKKRKEAIKEIKRLGDNLGGPFWKYPSWIYPTHPLRFDEVNRYLRIYDLRKDGKKWREIADKVYPRKSFTDDLRTALIKEEKKAKKIIKNVENGIFPGKY